MTRKSRANKKALSGPFGTVSLISGRKRILKMRIRRTDKSCERRFKEIDVDIPQSRVVFTKR
jgi:hypothetical protein